MRVLFLLALVSLLVTFSNALDSSWVIAGNRPTQTNSKFISNEWTQYSLEQFQQHPLYSTHPKSKNPKMTITFALKLRNREWLEPFFWEVSNPFSKTYGKYKTMDQLKQIISPDFSSQLTVHQFLRQTGLPSSISIKTTPLDDFIVVENVPVSWVETAFQTTVVALVHSETQHVLFRSVEPFYVPASVKQVCSFIGGISAFRGLPKFKQVKHWIRETNEEVDINLIRKQYNISDDISQGKAPNNIQAIASFLEQYYSSKDLQLFQQRYKLPDLKVEKVIGPNKEDKPGLEATLDIQYIMAVGANIRTWALSTPGEREGQEPFLEWAIQIGNFTEESPYVHSVSYGDDENSIELDYAQRLDDQFKVLGSTGRTILFASGDDGVGCTTSCKSQVPDWPTSSPYITAVGATTPSPKSPNGERSTSWSGGGFSNYYAQPGYQKNVLSDYLKQSKLPPRNLFNATGRAYPDVSAFGTNFVVAYFSGFTTVSGTSASTPAFAGIVSLLNDARLQAGKSPLGFLNPFIYLIAGPTKGAFQDIQEGENSSSCCKGFEAIPGYDANTGFGTPNVGILRQLVLSLP